MIETIQLHVAGPVGVETIHIKIAHAFTPMFSIWWERASSRDRALFAKYAQEHHQSRAHDAWRALEGDTWCSSYEKRASDEENVLLRAIQTRPGADADDENRLDVEEDEDDYLPPIQDQNTPIAILEDIDEDDA